jgi:uncharacterized membrane protein YGL010W
VRRVEGLLADYGSHHRTRGNLICHSFGVPLIVFGIFSMLRQIPVGLRGVTAAEVLLAAAFLFYLSLDIPLAFATAAAAGLLDLAAWRVGDWRIGLAAFLIGWVFQAVGHGRFEKNSPAFLRNLVHLLVGPLFLVHELLAARARMPAPGAPK